MATKTISITEDAYESLRAAGKEGQSFSQIIKKLTGRKNASSFAGFLSEKSAKNLEKNILESREKSRKRIDSLS